MQEKNNIFSKSFNFFTELLAESQLKITTFEETNLKLNNGIDNKGGLKTLNIAIASSGWEGLMPGLHKMETEPDSKTCANFHKSKYILTDSKLYYYDKLNSEISDIILQPPHLNELKGYFQISLELFSDEQLKFFNSKVNHPRYLPTYVKVDNKDIGAAYCRGMNVVIVEGKDGKIKEKK